MAAYLVMIIIFMRPKSPKRVHSCGSLTDTLSPLLAELVGFEPKRTNQRSCSVAEIAGGGLVHDGAPFVLLGGNICFFLRDGSFSLE